MTNRAKKQAEDRALSLIQSHGRLEKTVTPEASNGSYFSLPTGRVIHRGVCERLIETGRLKPCGDGLFDDSQTYIPA